MKKSCVITLLLSYNIAQAQTTLIPDSNFEQALIDLGYDTALDGGVVTSNISNITNLDVQGKSINDLTGIQDFVSLIGLDVCYNNLTSLDISNSPNMFSLEVTGNQLTGLDVSNLNQMYYFNCNDNNLTSLNITGCTALSNFYCNQNQILNLDLTTCANIVNLNCSYNELNELDVSNNLILSELYCHGNNLSSLNVTQNNALTYLGCTNNNLLCLNIKNGFNSSLSQFFAINNPSLSCIEVDNVAIATISANWYIDSQSSYSTSCSNSCYLNLVENTKSDFYLYPNPSTSGHIQTNINFNQSDIKIYSIEGKQINFTQSNNVLDISENEKGVYLISIDDVVTRYVYQD